MTVLQDVENSKQGLKDLEERILALEMQLSKLELLLKKNVEALWCWVGKPVNQSLDRGKEL